MDQPLHRTSGRAHTNRQLRTKGPEAERSGPESIHYLNDRARWQPGRRANSLERGASPQKGRKKKEQVRGVSRLVVHGEARQFGAWLEDFATLTGAYLPMGCR